MSIKYKNFSTSCCAVEFYIKVCYNSYMPYFNEIFGGTVMNYILVYLGITLGITVIAAVLALIRKINAMFTDKKD